MSEQTDPLAQRLAEHLPLPNMLLCSCDTPLKEPCPTDRTEFTFWEQYAEHIVAIFRAAVLADPTTVGMERDEPDGDWYCEEIACYATVNHDGERCPMHGGSATYGTLYRTPEGEGMSAEKRGRWDPRSETHPFKPVAGHPDDDECTFRSDGTDDTYCGQPEHRHETSER